jgi:superfamily II DNA or RNA helicase/HKD family nuclease
VAKNFITNEAGKALKERLIELIESSDELKFLVGFFYFSGLTELYEGLTKNPSVKLKVLVGMNVDQLNYNLVECADDDQNISISKKLERYFKDLQQSLTSEDFDTATFYEQVSFFVGLIKQDHLVIRKTQEPNHAKIYFFFDQDNQMKKKVFITGSSNLTRPAVTTQAEFNVEISDYGTEETEKYFDELWEDAIKITEKDEVKKRLISVIEANTMARKVTPFEAYALALKTYLDSFKRQNVSSSLTDLLKKHGYTPYRYQLDAVAQALAIINDYNGVIIADVVGLGKTIVACAVARELRKRGLVICPPNLMGDKYKKSGWSMYLDQFGLTDWEVHSSGDLVKVADYVQKNNDFEVVIIDEAHRFRNQDTKDYEFLKNICRNKTVILLSATPFNNRPSDILSLLKLFVAPKKSSITLENNLVSRFRSYQVVFERLSYISRYHNSPFPSNRNKAHSYYEGLFGEPSVDLSKVKGRSRYLAAEIRDVIEPVTIRRNRLDLQNNPIYKNEVKQLSKIADPEEWYFELTPEQSAFYDQIIQEYFGVPEEGGRSKGAIYRPFEYETEILEDLEKEENFEFIQQRNLYDFMRRLMVMRFESSFGSFEQSIRRFKRITEHALEFIQKTNRFILDRSLLEKIYSKDEEEIEDELKNFTEKLLNGNYPKNNRIYEVDKFVKKDEFIADINSDLRLYDEIIAKLDQMDLVTDDPKGNCLVEHIRDVLSQTPKPGEPKRKVVIFSQYKDTVDHLQNVLRPVFKQRLLTVSGNLSAKAIEQINQNFDASSKNQVDDFDIMLSTDRLSEGFNLNRAGMVINYDIPWNPVRVIQRVGRINRISKKVFDELFIVNFFPTEKGATEVKSREIAQNKMFLIHAVLGEDAKIFDVDEEPTASGLFERLTQSPDELEEESFYTKVLKLYQQLTQSHPGLAEELEHFPMRVKVAKAGTEDELLVLMRKNRLFIQAKAYNGEQGSPPYPLTFEQALPHITCAFEEPALPLSAAFWEQYQQTKELVEETREPLSPNSIEAKAYNNLKTLINLAKRDEDLAQCMQFIDMLLEDIKDYATLPDYTLRRIANLETTNADKREKLLDELKQLKADLGEHYLEKEKEQLKQTHKEIIIAIENQVL